MSTLTSSASPAVSPRLKYKPTSRAARSPRPQVSSPSSTLDSTTGIKRPADEASTGTSQSQAQKRPAHEYVDVGTQYSPEGYPPTAPPEKISALSGTKAKRKQSLEHAEPVGEGNSMAVSEERESPRSQPAAQASRNGLPEAEQENGHTASSSSSSEEERGAIDGQSQATSATEVLKRPRTDSHGLKIMPRKYETCDPMDLGVLIADMLLELIRLNDKIPLKDGKLTRFHSRAPPGISCHDYLRRLIQHATLSPPILLSMVFYIDKLCNMYPAFTIGSLTVHRFLITAATVASKGLSDSFWTNPTYARIGGISTSELATLELDFLQRVDFKIVPKPETLVDYYISLVQRSQDYRLEGEPANTLIDGDKMDVEPT